MKFFPVNLRWKGTLFIATSSLIALGVFSLVFTGYLSSRFMAERTGTARTLMSAIESGFSESMSHSDAGMVTRLFGSLSRQKDVRGVSVYDSRGFVTVSSRPIQRFPDRIDPQQHEAGRDQITIVEDEATGEHLLRLIRPVVNRPDCAGCHPASQKVLGYLEMESSLRPFDVFVAHSRFILLGTFFCIILLLAGLNYLVYARIVLRPLESLHRKIRQVEEGDASVTFQADTPGNEIRELEGRFGAMVQHLRHHHRNELDKEKEMALMVQDLKHQMEISAVNKQLAVRLRDLDLANMKVKRLAAQLEVKNLNLSKLVKKISALNRLGAALSSELEIKRLIRLVVNVAMKSLRAEAGFIMLMDEDTRLLALEYGVGLGQEYDQTTPMELGESISGLVAQRGEPILISDINREPDFRPMSRFGVLRRSVICAPLRVKDRMMGTIELTNKKGEEIFSGEDLEMLSSICAQAAIAIDNAQLYQKIQKSYFDTVRALIQAVEEKDRYTRGHSERVTLFALKIGEAMGLDQKVLDVLKYAGYLHDIGKIGIDIGILQKNGRLTAEEYLQVKNHPLIGERIIAPIEFLKNVRSCVSQHHERMDGTGYPNSLTGVQMTREARILSVADAYDAMITDRPYRRAFTREQATAELRRCSGTQFDPEIVEVFFQVLEGDHEIRELERQLSAVGT